MESGGRRDAISKAGAMGMMQLMPATARQYGVSDVSSFKQSSTGAALYYSDLLKHYHGDVRKAIAAYNWGQGNVDKDIATHGSKWDRHLPSETSGQLLKVLGIMAFRGNNANITVTNKSGTNVAVSSNAAGL